MGEKKKQKTTERTFQAANMQDLTREDLNITKKGKPQERN